ncbi:carbohydrate ABC transporter permease [Dactylosporangium siamense]|uniref:Transporter n=1 Tax=Dactylosporangium siamense TaxID=685454 RepID=A0A919UAI2_9ACTN|nr:sugar ABC transporter permease [Dactylosporangium siamense]GIG48549.1 transporter [Dactylosporangium siamense]
MSSTSTLARPATARPTRTRPRKRGLHSPHVLWLAVPSLVWFAVFAVGPLAAMFVIATLRWKGLLYEPTYAGTENISKVFADPTFYAAIRNSTVQVAVVIPLMIPLSFMLGYHLNSRPRGYRILSILYFSPGLISISVTGMVFYGVLSPDGGVNGVLRAVGLDTWATAWLADPGTALPTLIAIDLWRGIGWTAVLFAARLASLPADVLEAARIDGAGRLRTMWQIAFPMVKDYVRTLTMLQYLWTLFTSAALILLLTKGGPGTSSTTLSYLVYAKAFAQRDLGYSQVVGVVLLLLGIAGMALIHVLLRSPRENPR